MNRNQFSFISGILASSVYLLCAILAYIRYPLSYSPLTNWLSDLGNPVFNPQGAIIYNIGIILTALLLIVFFLGLSLWTIKDKKVQIIMLRLTQAFGIIGAVCMLMSGIFPISIYNIHAFLSTSLYILLATSFIFSAAMLRYHQEVPRWLLVLAVASAVIVILTSFFQTVHVIEWITVLLFLSYVSLLSVETKRFRSGILR